MSNFDSNLRLFSIMKYTYKYPRPMVTVDIILITNGQPQKLLLIQRKNDPFKNQWAFPGGFVEMDEELLDAAKRELKEETSVEIENLKQFKAYGSLKRDPRGRTITIMYYAFINAELMVKAADDAKDAKWFEMNQLPPLAFDHQTIIDEFTATTDLRDP